MQNNGNENAWGLMKQLLVRSLIQDEEYQTKLAKLLGAVGVELIYGWTAVLS